MAGEYTIEEQEHCVYVQFKDGSVVTPEMIIEALDSENALYPTGKQYDIWDFRACFPSESFGYNAMLKIVDHIETHYSDNWGIRTALLVDDATQFGLSRMFQTLSDVFPVQITIFQDEAEARRWVSKKGETP
ncbi:MAG: hypothetical protein P8X96_01990 [Desulfobacteraceae bacterium]|jgi:hypothetical protein